MKVLDRNQLFKKVAAAATAKSAACGHAVTSPDADRTDATNTVAGAEHPTYDGDDRKRMNMPKDGTPKAYGGVEAGSVITKATNPSGLGGYMPEASEHPQSGDKLAAVQANFRNLLADLTNPQGAPVNTSAKTAAASPDAGVEITPAFAVKLAHSIFTIEGGAELARQFLLKNHAQEEASAIVKNAFDSHAAFLTEVEYAGEMEKAASAQQSAANQYLSDIKAAFDAQTPEEQERIVKMASVHEKVRSQLPDHPWIKDAYAGGAADADADAEAAGPESAPSPEGGDGQTPSPEDLAQLIQMLVQSGEIPQEEGEKMLLELAAALQQGGGDPEGGAPPMGGDPEGGAPPMGGDPEAEATKEASAAIALINSVFQPAN